MTIKSGYSTVVNIVHLNKLNSHNTHASALDTMPRNCLFYKLGFLGLSYKIISIIQNSDFGVKQGCKLRPILFTLYPNDLAERESKITTISG